MHGCYGIRMIEFFSGIGGMRHAVDNSIKQPNSSLSLASCQAYDISVHANNAYKHNFPDDPSPVCTKLVEQLKPTDLDGKADLWTMSPPCQPFTTTMGSKSLDSEDKRCNGLKAIISLLNTIQEKPKHILLENVKGFATSQMIQDWHSCLQENGYSYKQYLVSPIQIGIPNHRQRYYILCERSDRWKDATGIEENIVSNEQNLFQQKVVGDYLDPELTDEDLNNFMVPDSILQKNWARQVGIVAKKDTATHCFTAGYGRIFHRATGSLLLTRTSEQDHPVAESPIDRSDMMKYSGQLRRFAPRELLALFGFPATFEFPQGVNLEQQYKLIGNSINVTVVTLLMKELLLSDRTRSRKSLLVGGTKGHVSEEIHGNLLQVYQAYRWKMIPNCTGRYTCQDHSKVSSLSAIEMLRKAGIESKGIGSIENGNTAADDLKEYCFWLPGRADKVCVIPLDAENRTGIITFVKEDRNAFVHTLNTPSGFRRKLDCIGIIVTETDVYLSDSIVPETPPAP
eukprot:scaffold25535_cov117-Cylindrotheca_fusiformis.AAC.5